MSFHTVVTITQNISHF